MNASEVGPSRTPVDLSPDTVLRRIRNFPRPTSFDEAAELSELVFTWSDLTGSNHRKLAMRLTAPSTQDLYEPFFAIWKWDGKGDEGRLNTWLLAARPVCKALRSLVETIPSCQTAGYEIRVLG